MELKSKRKGKIIRLADSLACAMTKELKELGLKKGDYVVISVLGDKIVIEKV